MGAVLEMIRRSAYWKQALFLPVVAALAGCAGDDNSLLGPVLGQVVDGVQSRNQPAEVAPLPNAVATPQALAAAPGPVVYARLEQAGTFTTLVGAARNGPVTTFLDTNGTSLGLIGPHLVATRGLGPDLMSVDSADNRAAVSARSGRAIRVHWTLNGLTEQVANSYVCDVVHAGSEQIITVSGARTLARVEERCQGALEDFTNIYWLDGAGRWQRSAQFVSPGRGMLILDRLKN